MTDSHLNGNGCQHCNWGFRYTRTKWVEYCNNKKNADPIVYIIRCFNNNEEFIKIGITSRSVRKRFYNKKSMPYEYEVIKEIKGSAGFVFNKENELHSLYSEYKYKPSIYFGGETECFNISILKILQNAHC